MGQRTRDELVAEIGFRLGIDVSAGSDGETSVIDAIDDAQRRVWTSREWKERRGQVFVATFAPYAPTADTVALTQGVNTVTGSAGVVFTTGMTGRKFTLALGSPHYVFTRTGATTGTLAQVYAETSETAAKFTIFADEYDTTTDVDRIVSVSVERPEWGGKMVPLEESALDGSAFVHGVTGIPRYYAKAIDTTTGTRRIRLWPIPDTIYRVRIRYWKSCADLASGSSVSSLGADKDRLLLYASLLEAQTLPGAVAITSEQQVEDMIETVWKVQSDDPSPMLFRRSRIDQGSANDLLWLDASNAIP